MTATDAYNYWEEAQIFGLTKLLQLIKRAATNDYKLSLVMSRDKVSDDQISALRRRNFIVNHKEPIPPQKIAKVEISWDNGGLTIYNIIT